MSKLRFLWEKLYIKKVTGVVLIILGLLALLTPFTPGSWVIFIGLEFLGLRHLFSDKWNNFWKRKE